MNNAIRSQWLRALASGNYPQGQGRLRNRENGYCCLGVLCDIIDPDGWEQDPDTEEWTHQGRDGMPSQQVLDAASLDTGEPTMDDPVGVLARMNDRGASFEVIGVTIAGFL